MKKTYNKPNNINQLHDEIRLSISELWRKISNDGYETDLTVHGDKNIIKLEFPSGFESQIDLLVSSHILGKSISELKEERIDLLKKRLQNDSITDIELREFLKEKFT